MLKENPQWNNNEALELVIPGEQRSLQQTSPALYLQTGEGRNKVTEHKSHFEL